MHSLKNAMSNLLSVSVDIPKEHNILLQSACIPTDYDLLLGEYIRTITHVPEEHKSLLVE